MEIVSVHLFDELPKASNKQINTISFGSSSLGPSLLGYNLIIPLVPQQRKASENGPLCQLLNQEGGARRYISDGGVII